MAVKDTKDAAGRDQEQPELPSMAGAVGQGLWSDAKGLLRGVLWGAGIGAVVLGAAGFWFFDGTGLLYGAAAGAVVGGLGALWFAMTL